MTAHKLSAFSPRHAPRTGQFVAAGVAALTIVLGGLAAPIGAEETGTAPKDKSTDECCTAEVAKTDDCCAEKGAPVVAKASVDDACCEMPDDDSTTATVVAVSNQSGATAPSADKSPDASCCAPTSDGGSVVASKVDAGNDLSKMAPPAMECCEMPGAEDEVQVAEASDETDEPAAINAQVDRDETGRLTVTVPSEADAEAMMTGLGFEVSFDNPYDDAPKDDAPYVPSFSANEIAALNTPVAPFALVDYDGNPFTNETLAGRAYIVDFIFTRCAGPCPAMSAQMSKVYRDVRGEGLPVDFVTVSVDPDYDTPEVMKRYSQWFNAGEGWHFLTGEEDQIRTLANDVLGVGLKKYGGKWDAIQYPGKLMADPIPETILHSQRFILIDDRGFIRGFYEGSEPSDINRLMRDLTLLASAE